MATAAFFDRYEEDVRTACVSLSKKIAKLATLTGDARRPVVLDIQQGLREADETIQQMQMEVRGAPVAERTKLQGRLREVSNEVSNLKLELRKSEEASRATKRDELFEGLRSDTGDQAGAADQRQKLVNQTERLQAGRATLQAAHRTALETEELGRDILVTLHEQRDQIESTRGRVRETDENVSRARTLLRGIARRVCGNKIILSIIILVILGIIGIVVWLVFFNGDAPPAPNNTTRLFLA